MDYAVVIEIPSDNYSACAPDLPGCVATGNAIEAVERELRGEIRFHIDGLGEDGLLHPPYPSEDQNSIAPFLRRPSTTCTKRTSSESCSKKIQFTS